MLPLCSVNSVSCGSNVNNINSEYSVNSVNCVHSVGAVYSAVMPPSLMVFVDTANLALNKWYTERRNIYCILNLKCSLNLINVPLYKEKCKWWFWKIKYDLCLNFVIAMSASWRWQSSKWRYGSKTEEQRWTSRIFLC